MKFNYAKIKGILEDEIKRAFKIESKKFNKKYFNPSEQPINEINNMEDVMKKMLFHAQNGTGKNGINFIRDILSEEKEKGCFYGFNPKEFIKNYKKYETWEKYAQENIKEKGWNGYLRTIFEVAEYLKQYKNISEFKQKIITEDMKQVNNLIKEIKSIYGFGDSFARDFIKECGQVNIVKPDIHVKTFFKKLFFADKTKVSAIAIDMKAREICNKFNELDKKQGWTPYKLDKYIYLICTHNFYNIDKFDKSNYRENLINRIEEACKEVHNAK